MLVKTGYESVGTTPDQYLSIRAEDANKMASLLIQKYKSRVTPIREIVINALETTDNAVKEGREFQPVEINFSMDDSLETSPFSTPEDIPVGSGTITVTDHGEGMSQEFVETVFSYLGASTKDQDSAAVGGFGIGSKSVLSMTDYATWRTVKDGVATVIAMSRDGDGFTINTSSTPTEDENGTVVTIPVSKDVMSYVVQNIESEFLDHIPAHRVVVTGDCFTIAVGNVVEQVSFTASNGCQIFNTQGMSRRDHSFNACMELHVEGVPYPVPQGAMMDRAQTFIIHGVEVSTYVPPIIVNLSQNDPEVIILGSREAVVESPEICSLIKERATQAFEEYLTHYFDEMIDSVDSVDSFLDTIGKFRDSDMMCSIRRGAASNHLIASRFSDAVDNLTSMMAESATPALRDIGTYDIEYCCRIVDIHSMVKDLCGVGMNRKVVYSTTPLFLDVENSSATSFVEVYRRGGSVLMGESAVKKNASVVASLQPWQQIVDDCLHLSSTQKQSDTLQKAESLQEITTDTGVDFMTPQSPSTFLIPITATILYLHLMNNKDTQETAELTWKFLEELCAPITITTDVEKIRDDAKNTIRKMNTKNVKRTTLTEEERLKRSNIHLYSYVPGSGYQPTGSFPSLPKFVEWAEKGDNEWVSIDGWNRDSYRPIHMKKDSYPETNQSYLSTWSDEQARMIAQSVPSGNLFLVSFKKHDMYSRASSAIRKYAVVDHFKTKGFFHAALSYQGFGSLMEQMNLSVTDAYAVVEGTEKMNYVDSRGNNLLLEFVDTLPVNDHYAEFARSYCENHAPHSAENRNYGDPMDAMDAMITYASALAPTTSVGHVFTTAARVMREVENGRYLRRDSEKSLVMRENITPVRLFAECVELVSTVYT